MQPGFASDEQYAMGKNRQDAAGNSHMPPQNTHMHSEYAPDADETVRGVLEQMQSPLPAQESDDGPLESLQAMLPPPPMQAMPMQASSQVVVPRPLLPGGAAERSKKTWLPSSREWSLLVLTVLLCVLFGILPIDRYVSLMCPCLSGHMSVAVVVVRAALVGCVLMLAARMCSL